MKETRNQRRGRRREETKKERELSEDKKLIYEIKAQLEKATYTLVFTSYYFGSFSGYVYSHPKFASGAMVTTSTVVKNRYEVKSGLWVAETKNSIFKVVRMSEAWSNVGAGNPLKRLIYKLWPKMIFIAMLQRIMYNPGNSGYIKAMCNFERTCEDSFKLKSL